MFCIQSKSIFILKFIIFNFKKIISKTTIHKFQKELEMAGGFRQLMAQKGVIRIAGNEVVILDTKGYQYWREVEGEIR